MVAHQTPLSSPRVPRLRRTRVPVDYVDASTAQRLRSRRRRWIVVTILVAVCLAVALAVNLAVPDFMVDPAKTVFSVGYSVGSSLLATFSVFAYLAQRDLAELIEETPIGLRLLNVVPKMRSDRGRVVIVVPVFPVLPEDVTKEFLAIRTDGTDIRRTAHGRRDMLVVHDILRLFYRAGLPRPIVLKDDNFCDQILEQGSHSEPLKVRENTDQSKAEQFEVSAIVSVGLFSNDFTIAMSKDARVPFTLFPQSDSEDRQSRTLEIYRPKSDGRPHSAGCNYETIKMPANEETGPDVGLIARLNFRDIPVCFIGGMTALATVRLGDFLFNRSDDISQFDYVAEFAIGRSAQTFCAIVECPEAGKRFEGEFKPQRLYWDDEEHGGLRSESAVSVAASAIKAARKKS